MRPRPLLVFALICLVPLALPSARLRTGSTARQRRFPSSFAWESGTWSAAGTTSSSSPGSSSSQVRPLRAAKLVSLFVAGHSLTLLIATFAGWRFNPELVDVVIALSLAYVGWRILAGRPRIWSGTQLAVFGFGLVHGLGLSSRLQEQPLPGGARLVADILAFNLGVEIGQLAVLSVVVAVGVLVKQRAGHLLPRLHYAGTAFTAVGLAAAAILGFSAAQPDQGATSASGTTAEGTRTQATIGAQTQSGCLESQQTPVFDGEASFGGHPQSFHDLDNPANPSDLAHVVGDAT